jgi:3-hydroxymyristoyl/3-hydroxydecanoyl-(acyl carrier protein) dehydratase
VWTRAEAERAGDQTTETFSTRLPEDYAFFDGHFPGYPILAGAVQLQELLLPCLTRARCDETRLTGLSSVKFPARIQPGDRLHVSLRFTDGSQRVRFEIRRGEVLCTHGLLDLATADPGDAP